MKSDLRKLWAVLTPGERRQTWLMILLMILMALAETVGVVSIMPFLSVLARPDIVQEHSALSWLYGRFEFESSQ